MKLNFFKYPLLVILIFLSSLKVLSFPGFWQRSNGPYGGFISNFIFRNDTTYCAGLGGLFRSTDAGDTWEFIGLGNLWVREMAEDDQYIYLAGYYGCYRYNPYSNIFEKIYDGAVQTIATVDSFVFLGIEYYPGIYRSTDQGSHWQESNSGINNYDIEKIFVTKSKTILASAAGASGSGIFRSTDFGQTWKRIDPYQFAWNFQGICEYKNTLYAYDFGNYVKVYISNNDGLNWWLPPGATHPADHIYAIHVDSTGLYVGTSDYGIFKSNNMGSSWRKINTGLNNKNIFQIDGNANKHYAASFDGVYTKPANLESWDYKIAGLSNTRINALISFNHKLFAGTHGTGLQISKDNGINWQRFDFPQNRFFIFDLHSTGQNIFAIASYDYLFPYYGKIYKSSDGGQTWNDVTHGFDTSLLECIRGNENFMLVGTEFGLFRSLDSGNTWKKVLNGIPNNINVADVAIMDSIAIVVNGSSHIYRTSDYGNHWENKPVPGLFSGVCVKSIGKKFYLGSSSVNEIFESTDYGKTWHKLTVPLSNSSVQDFAGDGKYIFAALSRNGGVIASADSGKHWKRINQSLTVKDVLCLLYEDGNLYAGTDGGAVFKYITADKPIRLIAPANNSVFNQNNITFKWHSFYGAKTYRFQLSEDSLFFDSMIDDVFIDDTVYQEKHLDYNKTYFYRISSVTDYWNSAFSESYSFKINPPATYILEQNFPNPFNSSTSIRYHVPRRSRVRIILYDISGRKIKTLVDKTEEPGSYRIKIGLTGLASGIYYYQLQGDNFTATKKCVLIK